MHLVFLWFCLLLSPCFQFISAQGACSGRGATVAWLFWERLPSEPAWEDASLLAVPSLDAGLFSVLFAIKTTKPFSSRSLASSPAAHPPARASPRGCSTLRTLQSMRTWRPCWRPPPSAGKAPRRSGSALEAGPAEVSASSFLLATFLVAQ